MELLHHIAQLFMGLIKALAQAVDLLLQTFRGRARCTRLSLKAAGVQAQRADLLNDGVVQLVSEVPALIAQGAAACLMLLRISYSKVLIR
ncbi:hypothetical protein CKO15_12825 [Halorhodospira abdelmalekii]|nr:hypothetical protein [Halorhodospira abdelmalekii]MBK1736138.1 hypothetical protein [Halorhodospira abdelmalekii]